MRPDVAAHALRSTIHATPLRPLLTVTSGVLLIGAITSRHSTQVPDVMVIAVVGALASGVVMGLDDEAHEVLKTSPTTALSRLALRLAILVALFFGAAGALVTADCMLFSQRSATPAPMAVAALVAAGIAIEVCWSRRRPVLAADGAAVVVMVWSLSGALFSDAVLVGAITDAWRGHASLVFVLSLLVVIAGTSGPEA
jgi:hypothetical protein